MPSNADTSDNRALHTANEAQTRDARSRLHDRVDQTQDRITENQVQVLEGFAALRSGLIRGLFAALLALTGGAAAMAWYLMTGRLAP